jgi:hypothetical protein
MKISKRTRAKLEKAGLYAYLITAIVIAPFFPFGSLMMIVAMQNRD